MWFNIIGLISDEGDGFWEKNFDSIKFCRNWTTGAAECAESCWKNNFWEILAFKKLPKCYMIDKLVIPCAPLYIQQPTYGHYLLRLAIYKQYFKHSISKKDRLLFYIFSNQPFEIDNRQQRLFHARIKRVLLNRHQLNYELRLVNWGKKFFEQYFWFTQMIY